MYRTMPSVGQLPYALYRAEQVRQLDQLAIGQYQIAGQTLMQRAGVAAFDRLLQIWPQTARVVVVTGSGNNAGDGYVLAGLALQHGLQVSLLELAQAERLTPDSSHFRDVYLQNGGKCLPFERLPQKSTDTVVVDAILGTGLNSLVRAHWAEAIRQINQSGMPVLSMDIPSGLNANTGKVMGIAVRAQQTVSFIGLKQGMFSGDARDYCGEIHFSALDVPARIYASQLPACRRIDWARLHTLLPGRRATAHKGDFGHLLVIGGNRGFSGAARLSAEAALRCGAGLVTVATHPEHAATLNLGRPEIMVQGVSDAQHLSGLLKRCDWLLVGPGLGQDAWAGAMLDAALQSGRPMLLDADALNLIASGIALPVNRHVILTPHPGEAARLLGCTVSAVEADRFAAIEQLVARFSATVVLKGAGTLIASTQNRPPAVCSGGNPGMASAGMGDVLAGVIATLAMQLGDTDDAACCGVSLHAAAADVAAMQGQTGLLASDLMLPLRRLLNSDDKHDHAIP